MSNLSRIQPPLRVEQEALSKTRRPMKRLIFVLASVGTISVFGLLIISPFRLTFGHHAAPDEVQTRASDGLPLRISLWRGNSADSTQRSAVLFIHGLTKRGPREPAYAVLCEALARYGLTVAAPWLRGYESDGSLNLGSKFVASQWNPLPDIAGAFEFLQNEPEVNPHNLVVLGHSLGGGYALLFGISESRTAGIVSISRLDMENRLRRWPGYFDYSRIEFSRAFGLDTPIPADAFQELANSQIFAFELAREALGGPDHPRVLFAIGSLERLSDRQWLAAYAARTEGVGEYYEFPSLTHRLNFRHLGWDIWLYDHQAIKRVALALAHWTHGWK